MEFIFILILIIVLVLSNKFRESIILTIKQFPILLKSTIRKYRSSQIKIFSFIILSSLLIEFAISILFNVFDIPITIQYNFLLDIVRIFILLIFFNHISKALFQQSLLAFYSSNYQSLKIYIIAMMSISFVLGFNYYCAPLASYFPKYEFFEEIKNKIMIIPKNTFETILLIFSIAIFPAIIEEIMFRGLLYKLIREKYSITTSVVVLTIVFYLFHLDPQMIPFIIVVNVLLCLTYEKTKSLVTPTLIHFGVNLGSLIIFLNTYN